MEGWGAVGREDVGLRDGGWGEAGQGWRLGWVGLDGRSGAA